MSIRVLSINKTADSAANRPRFSHLHVFDNYHHYSLNPPRKPWVGQRSERESLLFWLDLHVWDCETTAWCHLPLPGTPGGLPKSVFPSVADGCFSLAPSQDLSLRAFPLLHWLPPLLLSSALLTHSRSSSVPQGPGLPKCRQFPPSAQTLTFAAKGASW